MTDRRQRQVQAIFLALLLVGAEGLRTNVVDQHAESELAGQSIGLQQVTNSWRRSAVCKQHLMKDPAAAVARYNEKMGSLKNLTAVLREEQPKVRITKWLELRSRLTQFSSCNQLMIAERARGTAGGGKAAKQANVGKGDKADNAAVTEIPPELKEAMEKGENALTPNVKDSLKLITGMVSNFQVFPVFVGLEQCQFNPGKLDLEAAVGKDVSDSWTYTRNQMFGSDCSHTAVKKYMRFLEKENPTLHRVAVELNENIADLLNVKDRAYAAKTAIDECRAMEKRSVPKWRKQLSKSKAEKRLKAYMSAAHDLAKTTTEEIHDEEIPNDLSGQVKKEANVKESSLADVSEAFGKPSRKRAKTHATSSSAKRGSSRRESPRGGRGSARGRHGSARGSARGSLRQPLQPGVMQPGFAQQPGLVQPVQPGYAPVQQPGYAPVQQPGYAPVQQPGFVQPGFQGPQPMQPGYYPQQQVPMLPGVDDGGGGGGIVSGSFGVVKGAGNLIFGGFQAASTAIKIFKVVIAIAIIVAIYFGIMWVIDLFDGLFGFFGDIFGGIADAFNSVTGVVSGIGDFGGGAVDGISDIGGAIGGLR